MTIGGLALGLALILAADRAPAAESAADAITLRDGQLLLGQVVEPSPRGTLLVVVRRAWASEKLPVHAKRWAAAEAPSAHRAIQQRRDRLAAWRQERAGKVEGTDPILTWIDGELARLGDDRHPPDSRLMVVKLAPGDVRTLARRPKDSARILRQGWLSGFANVETMPLDDLKDAIEGRGFAANGQGTASIDRLLPIPSETDAQWLVRRAATEVANDSGLKFVQTNGLVLPEPAPGQTLDAGAALSVLGDLKSLLGDAPSDPLADRLRAVAARGRVGAVVTRLDISPELTAVTVESTLYYRSGADRWASAGARGATVRTDELAADAGRDIAEDPQVKSVFNIVEAIGLGGVSDEMKQRSLKIGAATQKALAQVRAACQEDLDRLVLPVADAAEKPAKPERP